jgi:hypothetical protein
MSEAAPFACGLLDRDWYGGTPLKLETHRSSMPAPLLDTDRMLRRLRKRLPADPELDDEDQAVNSTEKPGRWAWWAYWASRAET